MYKLHYLNVIRETESELEKDKLVALGYELILDSKQEQAEEEKEDKTEEEKEDKTEEDIDLKKLKINELKKIAADRGIEIADDILKKDLIELLEK